MHTDTYTSASAGPLHPIRMGWAVQRVAAIVAIASLLAVFFPDLPQSRGAHAASSWSPTLLVNTEAFQVIDDSDSAANLALRFGATVNEEIRWDRSADRFNITDDVYVEGGLETTGGITAGTTFQGASLADCDNALVSKLLWSDTGSFSCGTDQSGGGGLPAGSDTQVQFNDGGTAFGGDEQFVWDKNANRLDVRGTMSGEALRISSNADIWGTLSATGVIKSKSDITLNGDNDSNDAVLTFGSLPSAQTLKFINGSQRFEFSKPLWVNGQISGSGNLVVRTAAGAPAFKVDPTAGRVGVGKVTPSTSLDVVGVASGTNLYATKSLTGAHLNAAGTFGGAGLTDCTGTTNKLTWLSSGKRFGCETDQTGAGGGLDFPTAATYFVKDTGGSMTGGLLIETRANGTPATIDAGLQLEVVGTASGRILHAHDQLQSSGSLAVSNDMTLNSDKGAVDAVLTFGNVTAVQTLKFINGSQRFELSKPLWVNGQISGSGNLVVRTAAGAPAFKVDPTAGRVGIGKVTPATVLDVVGTVSGALVQGTAVNALQTFEGSGLADCDAATTSKLLWDVTTKRFSCGTDQTGGGGAPDTGIFLDTVPAAFADNNTTELFNDATKPNIVTDSTSATVLVSVHMRGTASNTANDAFLAARIVYTTNGVDPSCSTSTQLGEPMFGGFTTATTHPWQVAGTFLHNPGVAGTIKYTVCTSAEATGTATDTAEDVRVSIVELGG